MKKIGRAAIAGFIYACVMFLWARSQNDPFLGSYVLGFAFHSLMFGTLFGIGLELVERRNRNRD